MNAKTKSSGYKITSLAFALLRIILVFGGDDDEGLFRAFVRRSLLGYETLGRTGNGRVDTDCSFTAWRKRSVVAAAVAVIVAVSGVGARVVCFNDAREVSVNVLSRRKETQMRKERELMGGGIMVT